MQAYSNPKRADDPHALPDVEIWRVRARKGLSCDGQPMGTLQAGIGGPASLVACPMATLLDHSTLRPKRWRMRRRDSKMMRNKSRLTAMKRCRTRVSRGIRTTSKGVTSMSAIVYIDGRDYRDFGPRMDSHGVVRFEWSSRPYCAFCGGQRGRYLRLLRPPEWCCLGCDREADDR